MPEPTKLRDVIQGAIVDASLDCDEVDEALVCELIARRLGQAMLIELDDGTVFVRRPALRPKQP